MDKRIGAQLFTCRDYCHDLQGLDETMKKVAEIGYKTVQISGIAKDISGSDVRKTAEKYGLEIICTHRGLDEYFDELDETIKLHKDMRCTIAGLGWPGAEAYADERKLDEMIEKYNYIAERLAEEGLVFAYHNHALEFRKINGKTILEHLMEKTSDNFKLIFDVYWVAHAGADPVRVMEKYADRITVIHYKDKKVINANNADICEIGEGNLDWDGIIEATERLGIQWAMVEQDSGWIDNDPFRSLEISYKFLTKKGFI